MKLIFLLKLVTPGSGVFSAELSACFCCPLVAAKSQHVSGAHLTFGKNKSDLDQSKSKKANRQTKT